MPKIEIHRFFCIKCGREVMPLARKTNRLREKFHMKKLYCPWCKIEMNCVECTNETQVEIFKKQFNAGRFKEACATSLKHTGASE